MDLLMARWTSRSLLVYLEQTSFPWLQTACKFYVDFTAVSTPGPDEEPPEAYPICLTSFNLQWNWGIIEMTKLPPT